MPKIFTQQYFYNKKILKCMMLDIPVGFLTYHEWWSLDWGLTRPKRCSLQKQKARCSCCSWCLPAYRFPQTLHLGVASEPPDLGSDAYRHINTLPVSLFTVWLLNIQQISQCNQLSSMKNRRQLWLILVVKKLNLQRPLSLQYKKIKPITG